MDYKSINFQEKMSKIADKFSPKIIAQLNDYNFKMTKFRGDFVWHKHDDTDEAFIVLNGEMWIDFRDGTVNLKTGEMFVVPKGVEHKPFSEIECTVMLIEPAGTINTGDSGGTYTVEKEEWI